jgi:hypothetical protein
MSVLSQCPVEIFMIVDVSLLHAFDGFPDLLYIYFVVQTGVNLCFFLVILCTLEVPTGI